MRFRHSFQIAIDDFVNTFKLLLYRLATTVIFASLAYVILSLGLASITKSAEAGALKDVVYNFFGALFSGKTAVLESFNADFSAALTAFLGVIDTQSATIVGCVVGICLLYLVSRFVNGLSVFAVGVVVNDRMDSYSRTSFSQAYFSRIGSSALYQVIYVPLCFVYDALMLLSCWFFFFYIPSFLPSWGFFTVLIAISLTFTALACLEALKMTLISGWIPSIICDKMGAGKALAHSLREKNFGVRFANYLATVYVIVIVNVVAAIATVGSALLLTVPFSYLLLLCMQFVHYYREHGKKYFVSLHRIAGDEGNIE